MFLFPGGSSGSVAAIVSFETSAVDSTNSATYTFSGLAIGTPAADRKVVVALSQGSFKITTVTLDGVSMEFLGEASNNNNNIEFWQKNNVSTGTTAELVVPFSSGTLGVGVGVWAIYGAADPVTAIAASLVDDPAVLSLFIPANGVIVAAACNEAVGTPTAVWAHLFEDYDELVDGNRAHTGASKAVAVSEGPAITASFTPSSSLTTGVVASWAPA